MSAEAIRAQFGVLPTSEGYEVIALDTGRPVTLPRGVRSANATAQVLNAAAAFGRDALCKALTAARREDDLA